jgi:hypothetical protein
VGILLNYALKKLGFLNCYVKDLKKEHEGIEKPALQTGCRLGLTVL